MTILLTLLCCTYALASHHSHVIPVENYETELQDLGQHVEQHETPVKIIKITKTIAVKIPVPYPVKVVEKVPYPVHVAKPYPVQVPHVVQLPHERKVELRPRHEGAPGNYDTDENQGDSYKVQETPSQHSSSGGIHSFSPSAENVHLGEINYGGNQHLGNYDYPQGSPGHSYDAPVSGNHGFTSTDDGNIDESKIYKAIQSYL